MKIAVFFANGTEELEALTVVDVLRRTKAQCDIVSVNGNYPVGAHGICVKADKLVEDADMSVYDAIVVPGGMPGALNVSNDQAAVKGIKDAMNNKKLVAAICAAPAVVLAKHGLINGKTATCYPAPDFINAMSACKYSDKNVVVCDNLITANGPVSAFEFALTICDHLGLKASF